MGIYLSSRTEKLFVVMATRKKKKRRVHTLPLQKEKGNFHKKGKILLKHDESKQTILNKILETVILIF